MMRLNEWKSFNNNVSSKLAKINSSDALFWSYLAGLYDTDGSFSIKRQNKNKGTDVKNPRYMPVISLSGTDVSAINYMRENCYLGKLYMPRNKTCSNGFHYQIGIYTKKECIEFLNNIIPFLKVKKLNGAILLKFCEQSKNTKYCKAGISKEELEFRDQCYKDLVSINKYGVLKPSLIDLEA
jgi:hypothetical protein